MKSHFAIYQKLIYYQVTKLRFISSGRARVPSSGANELGGVKIGNNWVGGKSDMFACLQGADGSPDVTGQFFFQTLGFLTITI